MTKITFLMKDGLFTGFEACGHASFDVSGKDVVCAAISVLTTNTVNALSEINHEELSVNTYEGVMTVKMKSNYEKSSQTLFQALELGLIGISKKYGSKYCKVDYKEENANVRA